MNFGLLLIFITCSSTIMIIGQLSRKYFAIDSLKYNLKNITSVIHVYTM